jgi:hypothetical protein
MKFWFAFSFLLMLSFSQCSDRLISRQDILDLLDEKNSAPAEASSSNNSRAEDPNRTQINNSQNLDYNGLTSSPTGTTTGGAVGSPAGANPLGR